MNDRTSVANCLRIRRKPLVRIVDDNPGLVESLVFMLRSEGFLTKGYLSAEAFLEEDDPAMPGCLILDVKMPGLSGPELQAILSSRGSTLPLIFLTAHGDIDMAVDAIHGGAVDFQQKPVDPARLIPAVAKAAERSLAGLKHEESIQTLLQRVGSLTPREEQTLRAVSKGLSSRAVAEQFGLAKTTVDHARASGAAKLGESEPALLALLFERCDVWRATHSRLPNRYLS